MHDTPALPSGIPAIQTPIEERSKPVRHLNSLHERCPDTIQTLKGNANPSGDTLKVPTSHGRASGRSVGKGDLDQAIRSMRDGKRRARPERRPLSKIFLDGSSRQSRIYE